MLGHLHSHPGLHAARRLQVGHSGQARLRGTYTVRGKETRFQTLDSKVNAQHTICFNVDGIVILVLRLSAENMLEA